MVLFPCHIALQIFNQDIFNLYVWFILDTDECGVENGHCNFLCIQTPRGAECVCPVGQVLNGTKECMGM